MTLIFDTDIEELTIAFDMEKVERIILNLVSNAIKFRKEENGEIFINLQSSKDFVTISVRDNGIGISKENIDKIFGKYVRLNDERSMIKEGTGIGQSSKDFVTISVRDNGIGISKENIDKIFGKYVRLNDERSMIKEGTGIGLSLVESLTNLHGGKVSVDSSFGNWTEFKVQIPNIVCDKKIEYVINSNNLDRVEKIKIEFSDIYN